MTRDEEENAVKLLARDIGIYNLVDIAMRLMPSLANRFDPQREYPGSYGAVSPTLDADQLNQGRKE